MSMVYIVSVWTFIPTDIIYIYRAQCFVLITLIDLCAIEVVDCLIHTACRCLVCIRSQVYIQLLAFAHQKCRIIRSLNAAYTPLQCVTAPTERPVVAWFGRKCKQELSLGAGSRCNVPVEEVSRFIDELNKLPVNNIELAGGGGVVN